MKDDYVMELRKKTISKFLLGLITNESLGSAFLVLLMAVIMTISSDTFLTSRNILNVLRQSSFYIIAALGILCVIIAGGLDLSVGGTMGLAGIVASMMARGNMNTALIIILCTMIGVVVGAINGYLIGYMKLPAFIITLGMSLVLRGTTTIVSEGFPVNNLSASFNAIGTSIWFGIPSPIWITVFLCIVTWYLLNRTLYGRHLYACGSNTQAAIVSGISEKRVSLLAYVYCGAFAAFAGILLTSRMMTGQVGTGQGYELLAIAGIVIGGAAIGGGSGTVVGTVFGLIVITIVNNALTLLGMNAFYQSATQGLIIILATMLDAGRRTLKSRIKN